MALGRLGELAMGEVVIPIEQETVDHLIALYGPDWLQTREGVQACLLDHIAKLHRQYGVPDREQTDPETP